MERKTRILIKIILIRFCVRDPVIAGVTLAQRRRRKDYFKTLP